MVSLSQSPCPFIRMCIVCALDLTSEQHFSRKSNENIHLTGRVIYMVELNSLSNGFAIKDRTNANSTFDDRNFAGDEPALESKPPLPPPRTLGWSWRTYWQRGPESFVFALDRVELPSSHDPGLACRLSRIYFIVLCAAPQLAITL